MYAEKLNDDNLIATNNVHKNKSQTTIRRYSLVNVRINKICYLFYSKPIRVQNNALLTYSGMHCIDTHEQKSEHC